MSNKRLWRRVYWDEVKERFKKINPVLAKIIQSIPDDFSLYPMYLMNYQYGDVVGDGEGVFFPCNDSGDFFQLGDKNTPGTVMTDLGYGAASCPMGMFFDKGFEWYSTAPGDDDVYPTFLDMPGNLFSTGSVLNFNSDKVYLPNGILSVCAGARSVFSLYGIGCNEFHQRLVRDYGISTALPEDYRSHWAVFKDLSNSRHITNTWSASILFFSEKWINSINHSPLWREFKDYIQSLSLSRCQYDLNIRYYNYIFNAANMRNNLFKKNHLYEIGRYLCEILMGESLAYGCVSNNDLLPLDIIKEAYEDCYKIRKDFLVMAPSSLSNASNGSKNVYFSLKKPSFCHYMPKSISASSALLDLDTIRVVMEKYLRDFSMPVPESKGTVLEEAAKRGCLKFYHNKSNTKENSYAAISEPSQIVCDDPKMAMMSKRGFPSNAAFFQGCVGLSLP